MTVFSTIGKKVFIGNDVATEFSYNFKVFKATDLIVLLTDSANVETVLVDGIDYTISGLDTNNGSITYPISGTPLTTGQKLTAWRVPGIIQDTDLNNQGGFFPQVHENFFDLAIMISQYLEEQGMRALRFAVSDQSGASTVLPSPEALKVLRWDSSGSAIQNIDLGSVILAIPADESVNASKIDGGDIVAIRAKLVVPTTADVLLRTGGTMTGKIILDGDATTALNPVPVQQLQKGNLIYVADSGSVNVYAMTLTPPITSYTRGQTFFMDGGVGNTIATPTLNVNALGAKTIKRPNGGPLNIGDMPSNHKAHFFYDGTDMILLNPTLHDHSDAGQGGAIIQPSFSVHNNGVNQNIASGTWTKVLFSTEEFDTNGDFSSSRFTPSVAGKYSFMAALQLVSDVDAPAIFKAAIYKNGVHYKEISHQDNALINLSGNLAILSNANGSSDYFEIYVFQNGTGTETLSGASGLSWFMGSKVDI